MFITWRWCFLHLSVVFLSSRAFPTSIIHPSLTFAHPPSLSLLIQRLVDLLILTPPTSPAHLHLTTALDHAITAATRMATQPSSPSPPLPPLSHSTITNPVHQFTSHTIRILTPILPLSPLPPPSTSSQSLRGGATKTPCRQPNSVSYAALSSRTASRLATASAKKKRCWASLLTEKAVPLRDRTNYLRALFCVPLTFSEAEVDCGVARIKEIQGLDDAAARTLRHSLLAKQRLIYVEAADFNEGCPFNQSGGVETDLFFDLLHHRAMAALEHLIELIVHEIRNPRQDELLTNREHVLQIIDSHLFDDSQKFADICLEHQEEIWPHLYSNIVNQNEYAKAAASIRARFTRT